MSPLRIYINLPVRKKNFDAAPKRWTHDNFFMSFLFGKWKWTGKKGTTMRTKRRRRQKEKRYIFLTATCKKQCQIDSLTSWCFFSFAFHTPQQTLSRQIWPLHFPFTAVWFYTLLGGLAKFVCFLSLRKPIFQDVGQNFYTDFFCKFF